METSMQIATLHSKTRAPRALFSADAIIVIIAQCTHYLPIKWIAVYHPVFNGFRLLRVIDFFRVGPTRSSFFFSFRGSTCKWGATERHPGAASEPILFICSPLILQRKRLFCLYGRIPICCHKWCIKILTLQRTSNRNRAGEKSTEGNSPRYDA